MFNTMQHQVDQVVALPMEQSVLQVLESMDREMPVHLAEISSQRVRN
jgi:hypothetical protein